MNKFYKITFVAVLFAMTMPMIRVANAAKTSICFVTFSLQIGYFQSSVAGGKSAAKELGVDIVVMEFVNESFSLFISSLFLSSFLSFFWLIKR